MVGHGGKERETVYREQANQAMNSNSYQITAILTYYTTTNSKFSAFAFHTPNVR